MMSWTIHIGAHRLDNSAKCPADRPPARPPDPIICTAPTNTGNVVVPAAAIAGPGPGRVIADVRWGWLINCTAGLDAAAGECLLYDVISSSVHRSGWTAQPMILWNTVSVVTSRNANTDDPKIWQRFYGDQLIIVIIVIIIIIIITHQVQHIKETRICAAEMAVRYAALSACRKVHPWR